MKIRVFLADDHTVLRDGLCMLLEAQEDIVVVGGAGDGREAVLQIRELKPDVVIMDIVMPDLNGIEAARQISDASLDTRVIILSMHVTAEHVFRALWAGALGYVLKESAGSEVVKAVRAVSQGRRYLSPSVEEVLVEDYLHHREQAEAVSPLEKLSDREREVLQLVVEGKSTTDIAKILFLSPETVKTYRSRMMQKLNISDLPSLVKFAIQHDLTPLK